MRDRKKFLTVCALMAGIGLALTGVGVAMGGVVHGIRINSEGIHVYAPLLYDLDRKNGTGAYVQKEEQLEEAFDRIEIDAEYADIRIERSDSDACMLSYGLSGDKQLQTEVKDGKLVLKHGYLGSNNLNVSWFLIGTGNIFGSDQREFITLRLPEDAELSEAVLSTDSGDVTCENIQADQLKITAEYGDISLARVQAGNLEMELESGKLRMEEVRGGSCKVENEYGDISLYDLALDGDMQLKAESGNIKFRNAQMHALALDSAYGEVDGEQTRFTDAQMTLESGNCRMKGVLFDSCQIKSSYGDVDLELENDVTDYAYQLKTEYGKIEIAGQTMGETYSSLENDLAKKINIACESGDIRIE